MEVDLVVAEFDVIASNEEENELMMLAMKEAEDLDDNMELEPPTLARGWDMLLQTTKAIRDEIHKDSPAHKVQDQGCSIKGYVKRDAGKVTAKHQNTG